MASASPVLYPGQKGLAAYERLYSVNLNRSWTINGAEWRLVKAAAALTTIGRATVIHTLTAGLPNGAVNTTTTANLVTVAGVCSSAQVDLATGDYFLVQISGFCEVISAAAIATDVAIGTSTTAKKCDDVGITAPGTLGYSLESAAGVDENVGVRLVHL